MNLNKINRGGVLENFAKFTGKLFWPRPSTLL